jgi:hypothetical protein
MRNEHGRSFPRTRRPSRMAERQDLADWRRLTRPITLDDFLNRTRDLYWTRNARDVARSPRRRRRALSQVPRGRCVSGRRVVSDVNPPGHHAWDSAAPVGPVKPLRFASTPSGLTGLTGPPGRHRKASTVMARELSDKQLRNQRPSGWRRVVPLDRDADSATSGV